MYTDFYRLSGFPFQLTPDFRFFFDSRPHRKAMAYLTYGLSKGEGFVVITGEVGAGKTTLIDYLLSSLQGKSIVTARIVTTQIQADDLLRLVASSFGIPSQDADKATLLRRLETFFIGNLQAGRRSFLVIDEAQSLAPSSLEELRMLSNFQVEHQPVLQMYLVGQPEFRRLLSSGTLEQLRQRVIASYHLVPLDAEETRAYILHRLQRVGWQNDPVFGEDTIAKVYEHTGGVPRKINLLCDRLLLFGYLEEKHALGVNDVADVVGDLEQEVTSPAAPMHAAPRPDVAVSRQDLRAMFDTPPAAPAAPPPSPAPRLAFDEINDNGSGMGARQNSVGQFERLIKRVVALERRLKGNGG